MLLSSPSSLLASAAEAVAVVGSSLVLLEVAPVGSAVEAEFMSSFLPLHPRIDLRNFFHFSFPLGLDLLLRYLQCLVVWA